MLQCVGISPPPPTPRTKLWLRELSRLPGDFLSHPLQRTTLCSQERTGAWRKGLHSPRGQGGGLNPIQSLGPPRSLQRKSWAACLPLRPLLGGWLNPCSAPVPPTLEAEEEDWVFQEAEWEKDKLLQSNEHERCLPRAGAGAPGTPQPRRWALPLAHGRESLRWWLQEQCRSRAWSGDPEAPECCWAVAVGKDEEVRGSLAWPIRDPRRTRRCSGCPWWWGAPRGSV